MYNSILEEEEQLMRKPIEDETFEEWEERVNCWYDNLSDDELSELLDMKELNY